MLGGGILKFSSIQLKSEKDGLQPFNKINLGDVVVISGGNGSGKTRLLKLLQQHINSLRAGNDDGYLELEIPDPSHQILSTQNINSVELVNYSHYDARLQVPNYFTPYVITKAKNILQKCNYEETALNSLLLLEDMANGYSEEYKDGCAFDTIAQQLYQMFNIKIEKDNSSNHLKISGLDADKSSLSPGQQYLLRIAIACYCNQLDSKLIFILDEPELHLHPQALIELFNTLRKKFPKIQFWISTHSLALISYITVVEKNSTVLYMNNGKTSLMRSDSSQLLSGLIGTEQNRFAIQQLLALPDEYACNKFSVECYYPPDTISASGNDPQTNMIQTFLQPNDVVVDFGVGKGRFFEELAISGNDNIASKIEYYAYDKFDDDSEFCKQTMNNYGSTDVNYFNDINALINKIQGTAKYVLLVNVLHEIPPAEWPEMFSAIKQLLMDTGKLIIVEREELTIGEAPYDNGFLMLTYNGALELFGNGNFTVERHNTKSYIVRYIIEKQGLLIDEEKTKLCVDQIKNDSLKKIKELKLTKSNSDIQRYKSGIQLAFYLQQYANATIINESK